jgi:sucrose phosphorylase
MAGSTQYGSLVPDTSRFASTISRRLQIIYKSEFYEGLVNRILAMTNVRFAGHPSWNENDIVLITYGNSLVHQDEKPLRTLHCFLNARLTGVISCVHMLPFFPFTSDDGFAVSNFMEVNPSLGDWEDVAAFNGHFGLMSDLVINHVSSEHPWFKNYLQDRAPGKGYFIEAESGQDYSQVVRPRSTPLFTQFATTMGPKEIWTTFGEDQVDLNFRNQEVLIEMIRVLIFYISRGIRIIRLDAIAFLWKSKGTPCLHLPETHEIVKLLRDIVTFISPGTIILTETNVPNKENWSYFGAGDEAHMVYQFSLPPLLLHALFSGNSKVLTSWAAGIPQVNTDQTFLNYTASHDGIGVRPLEGILPEEELLRLINGMIGFGGMVSRKSNANGTLSPYELNITYFDAMKGTWKGADHLHESRFLCSQVIMMSLRGIPAFYIHSLLATANDHEGVHSTGRARSINRRQLNTDDINTWLSTDTRQGRVFKELTRLIGIRKRCKAFHPNGKQKVMQLGENVFAFIRQDPSDVNGEVYCISNVTDHPVEIGKVLPENKKGYDLISGDWFAASDPILFKACQTRWIVAQDAL